MTRLIDTAAQIERGIARLDEPQRMHLLAKLGRMVPTVHVTFPTSSQNCCHIHMRWGRRNDARVVSLCQSYDTIVAANVQELRQGKQTSAWSPDLAFSTTSRRHAYRFLDTVGLGRNDALQLKPSDFDAWCDSMGLVLPTGMIGGEA
ncbi:MAG: hypothetical protein JSV86_05540 [Gemmatimonadota bacterium]|nr:MAG: hypothetical protein JSV86_05540 [Gemmatimonadota bacterium]